jgi:hypothetical protein
MCRQEREKLLQGGVAGTGHSLLYGNEQDVSAGGAAWASLDTATAGFSKTTSNMERERAKLEVMKRQQQKQVDFFIENKMR